MQTLIMDMQGPTNGDLSNEIEFTNDHIKSEETAAINVDNSISPGTQDEKTALKEVPESDLLYSVEQSPPWHVRILLGVQHFIVVFLFATSTTYILVDNLCIGSDPTVKAELMGNMLHLSSLMTTIQVVLGVRLPVIESQTFALLVPAVSYLQLSKHQCPVLRDNCSLISENITCVDKGSVEYENLWHSQIRVIQGSIMLASIVPLMVGMTGGIGFLMKYIGPMTIAPTISLVGLSMIRNAGGYVAKNWPVSLLVILLVVIFSQYLDSIQVPLPKCSRKKGIWKGKFYLFKMFPIIFAILLSWLICFILTSINAIPNDSNHWAYGARTDVHSDILSKAVWVNSFYPGKYGAPRLDVALVCGVMVGMFASIIESVADFYICAQVARVPLPPKSALNRGIMIEGLGCFLGGAFGTGNGVACVSHNLGLMKFTGVASKSVVMVASTLIVIAGIFTKIGAFFVTIPEPIIGAVFIVMFGFLLAVGVSHLQYVDFSSARNLFIFGFSVFMGLSLSQWATSGPGLVNTGVDSLDSSITVLLSTGVFVGGLLAFVLDNTVPGTDKERGLLWMQNEVISEEEALKHNTFYDVPKIGAQCSKLSCTKYVPICQNYEH